MTIAGPDLRAVEIQSIRAYVEARKKLLTGRVLDFGAGRPGTCRQPEPFRDLVTGEYVPVDKGDEIPPGRFDAILMTQVIQYLDDPFTTLVTLRALLFGHGVLMITGPTNWPEVEPTDLWRFTCAGIRRLLVDAGFSVMEVESRARIEVGGLWFSLGWGALARRLS